MAEKLTHRQITNLKYLAVMTASGSGATLKQSDREVMLPLWRRGLVEIWYRQVPNSKPSLQGPFYRLAASGERLVSALIAGLERVRTGEAGA